MDPGGGIEMMIGRVLVLAVVLLVSRVESRPNIILIITDDQDIVLNGMTPMNKTRRLVADEGVTFASAFTTTPLCCPSRSSILTGLYMHNHGTVNNSISGGCCGEKWQAEFEPRTFGAALQRSGYRTFYAGKYLNQYGRKQSGGVQHVPIGWDWWIGLVGNSVYYNYTLSVNGSAVVKGDREEDYLTDVLRDYAVEFLRDVRSPFLMILSPPAPHEPFTPARRHAGTFAGVSAPRTPNFNRPAYGTKHWLLRLLPDVLPESVVEDIDDIYRRRWETLLSVDEMIERVVLSAPDAYIIVTSDNGFHLGQFGQAWDKRQPYETDIRIPLIMSGPDVPAGHITSQVALNIDIAPTVLDLAGVRPSRPMDGVSLTSVVNEVTDAPDERVFFVEYRGEGGQGEPCYNDPNVKLCSPEAACKCFDSRNNTFDCIRRLGRDVNMIYCLFRDSENYAEMYDLIKDPYQIRNLAVGPVGDVERARLRIVYN